MNYLKTISLTLIFSSNIIFSQSWKNATKNDAFQGKTIIAYSIGNGGKLPYDAPTIVFKNSESEGITAYLTRAGSFVCDNATAVFAFNGQYNDKLKLHLTPSNDNEYGYFDESNFKLMNEFIKKLKSSNNVDVLLETDCSSNRFKFNLSGSTKAINNVVGDYFLNKVNAKKKEDNALLPNYEAWKNRLEMDINHIFKNYKPQDYYGKNDIDLESFKNLIYNEIMYPDDNLFDCYKNNIGEFESLLIIGLYVKEPDYSFEKYEILGRTNKYSDKSIFTNKIDSPKLIKR